MDSQSLDLSFEKHRTLIYLLLFLASVHCARSIFFSNVSLLELPSYAAGTERLPFQSRVAMIPVLRWAHTSDLMRKAAGFMDASLCRTPHYSNPPEHVTPEKLACIATGVIAILAMTFGTSWFCRRNTPGLWWLGGALVLLILYTTYAARYEANYWYPYDLPHFAIFGGATISVLEGAWVPFFVFLIADALVRETSIYLIVVASAVAAARGHWRPLIALVLAVPFFWLPIHLYLMHRFATNSSDVGVHWSGMLHSIINPLHWPQLASAGGFLAVPLWLGRTNLNADERAFLYASIPCVMLTILFGMWFETRIFGEWTVAIAILLTSELTTVLNHAALTRQVAT